MLLLEVMRGWSVAKKGSNRQKKRTTSSVASAAGAIGRAVAAVVNRVAGGPDAIRLLKDDHKELKALMKRAETLTDRAVKARRDLFATVKRELDAHELIEEKIFYPALKNRPAAKDIVLEGYQEHHVADLLVAELARLPKSDERWGAKFKVLQENIEHHIEEEEGEMFKRARSVFSRRELQAMGEKMASLKQRTLRRRRRGNGVE